MAELPIIGTDGPESILGGTGQDKILAGGGNDTVSGLAGDDAIDLGDGSDNYGVTGTYLTILEEGSDTVFGRSGNDSIWDWSGANLLYGDWGNDSLSGATFANFDALADTLRGGDGDDTLSGDNGDRMSGGSGADLFTVRMSGRPVVITDALSEAQAGPLADDVLILVPNGSTVRLEDWLWFGGSADGQDRIVTLGGVAVAVLKDAAGQRPNVELQAASYRDANTGGDGADLLSGTDRGDVMTGGQGDDSLIGRGGGDFVNDGSGNDEVHLGRGGDLFHGGDWVVSGQDNDDIHGGAGRDTVLTFLGADTVHGDAGADVLNTEDLAGQSGPVADVVSGGAGNDWFAADAGDTLAGNGGADVFELFWSNGLVTIKDFVLGEDVLNIFTGGNVVSLSTTDGSDTLVEVDGQGVALLSHIAFGTVTLADLGF